LNTPLRILLLLACALLVTFFLDLALGSLRLSPAQIIAALFQSDSDPILRAVIWDYRVPKALAAVAVGAGLALAGQLLQTLFRNPMAGPFEMGVSAGATLGVALVTLAAGPWIQRLGGGLLAAAGQAGAAGIGATLSLLILLALAPRVRDSVSLLLVGLVLTMLIGAVTGILQYFSDPGRLQAFAFWNLGALGGVSQRELPILAAFMAPGFLLAFALAKPLNALLLGEDAALGLGWRMGRLRLGILLATSLLAGTATAFCGPVAFIGIAVPHLSRLWLRRADHRLLLPASALLGAAFLCLCDALAQWPGGARILPLNATTSLLGAPLVLAMLLRRRSNGGLW
jgi:iron complex transport system permease protein